MSNFCTEGNSVCWILIQDLHWDTTFVDWLHPRKSRTNRSNLFCEPRKYIDSLACAQVITPGHIMRSNPILLSISYYFVRTKHSKNCAGRCICGVAYPITRTVPIFMIIFASFEIVASVDCPENGHQQARRAKSMIILAVTTTQTLTPIIGWHVGAVISARPAPLESAGKRAWK